MNICPHCREAGGIKTWEKRFSSRGAPVTCKLCGGLSHVKGMEVYPAYARTKIFLTPKTSEMLERVLFGLQEPVEMYSLYLANYDDHELHTLRDRKEDAWEEVNEVVPPVLIELENEFRAVLGVVERG